MEPSSASEPVAEQVNVLPTETPVLGEIDAVVIDGTVFSTLTLAESESADPLESVAVAVHVTDEPTSVSDALTVYVLPVPTVELPTVQA